MPEQEKCFSIEWATLSGPVAVEEKKLEAAARNSAGEKKSKKTSETPQGMWLAELREVAFGSTVHGLWLRNGKVRSQVSGIDQSRFPRRTVGEVRRGGR